MCEKYDFLSSFITQEGRPTPAYVFDLDCFGETVRMVQETLGKRAEICFAMKANPFLTRRAAELVSALEVCSPGEFRICERLGIPMEKIVLSGVYKNPVDIRRVLVMYGGRGAYTAESLGQLELLNREAASAGLRIPVLLRVTSGNQFGMDSEKIRELISHRQDFPGAEIVGLQFYSGTQKKDLGQMEQELAFLDGFLAELERDFGFQAQVLEYGPGLAVSYFQKDHLPEAAETLRNFRGLLDRMAFPGRIVLEMGRFLAAACGYYLTSVADKKVNNGQQYLILDGGIHQLNYYGQVMGMKQPFVRQFTADGKLKQMDVEAPLAEDLVTAVSVETEVRFRKDEGRACKKERWTLCGALCTTGDVIVKGMELISPEIGDILAFERTGAYSVTEGISLFLSRPLPSVYFWSRKEGLRRVRQAYETDILNAEV